MNLDAGSTNVVTAALVRRVIPRTRIGALLLHDHIVARILVLFLHHAVYCHSVLRPQPGAQLAYIGCTLLLHRLCVVLLSERVFVFYSNFTHYGDPVIVVRHLERLVRATCVVAFGDLTFQ